jgi:hypothetical protein
MEIADTRMITSITDHGRRNWVKQAITGSVAAGLADLFLARPPLSGRG